MRFLEETKRKGAYKIIIVCFFGLCVKGLIDHSSFSKKICHLLFKEWSLLSFIPLGKERLEMRDLAIMNDESKFYHPKAILEFSVKGTDARQSGKHMNHSTS